MRPLQGRAASRAPPQRSPCPSASPLWWEPAPSGRCQPTATRHSPERLRSDPGPTAAPLPPRDMQDPPFPMGYSGWSSSSGAAPGSTITGACFHPSCTEPNGSRSTGGDLGAGSPRPLRPCGHRGAAPSTPPRIQPVPWGMALGTAGLWWPRCQEVPRPVWGHGGGRHPRRRHREHGTGASGGVQRYRERARMPGHHRSCPLHRFGSPSLASGARPRAGGLWWARGHAAG